MDGVRITRLLGGGDSWFYAVCGGRVLDAAHEDDREGMARLKRLKVIHAPARRAA